MPKARGKKEQKRLQGTVITQLRLYKLQIGQICLLFTSFSEHFALKSRNLMTKICLLPLILGTLKSCHPFDHCAGLGKNKFWKEFSFVSSFLFVSHGDISKLHIEIYMYHQRKTVIFILHHIFIVLKMDIVVVVLLLEFFLKGFYITARKKAHTH